MQELKPGAFDKSLVRLLATLPNQIFGEIAEEKDANVFVANREAKKMRAYDTYELLARGITFSTHLSSLLSLVNPNPCTSPSRLIVAETN